MGTAKWIRFAVLLSFVGVFLWLAYIRGGMIWLLPAAAFMVFAVLSIRK
jgi:F0F1-type ATP synthase assembly protein I